MVTQVQVVTQVNGALAVTQVQVDIADIQESVDIQV